MDRLLFKNIAESNASRKSRDDNAADVINRRLSDDLITLALDVTDQNHFKACWILERVLEKNLQFLSPRLTDFCDNLPNWKHDSALRSVSKICMLCAQQANAQPDFLSPDQIVQITEASFQWLIAEEKVAAKAYAIHTLFETGKRLDWVYDELVPILQHGFPDHSPAYKSAARQALSKIKR